MKIQFDIDATPQELRSFFGLPDVEPIQQEMMEMIRRNMQAGMVGFDPATLLKPWLPNHLQTMEAMQKAFWEGFTKSGTDTENPVA